MDLQRFIRWFDEITIADVPLVGGKNASLGEMYRELASAGVRVPNGFAVTADAYRYFLSSTGTDARVRALAAKEHVGLVETLADRIARMIIADFRAPRVRVCITKLGVVRNAKHVGVCVERTKT